MIESQIVARVLPSKCREAVKVLLQEVYGYEDFRNLEVYDDLFRGKEKLIRRSDRFTVGTYPAGNDISTDITKYVLRDANGYPYGIDRDA